MSILYLRPLFLPSSGFLAAMVEGIKYPRDGQNRSLVRFGMVAEKIEELVSVG